MSLSQKKVINKYVFYLVKKKLSHNCDEKFSFQKSALSWCGKCKRIGVVFLLVSNRGSILYFVIVEMSMVNCMYQTSLKQFLELFDLSMHNSQKSPITSKRINNIIEYLTFEVFRYTARGLYEVDKFLYTTLLTCKVELNQGKIRMEEFQTFIKGGAALDLNAVEPKPKKWISDITWLNLVELSKLGQFSQICSQVARNDKVGLARSRKFWFLLGKEMFV